MSRTGRRSDGLAPTLFPFLAVLLCTMGSLVLILMLLVAGAQTSAREVAAELDQQFQWEQEKLQLATHKLTKEYEDSKLELEKKRLVLQNLENHIQELMDELEQLEKTAEQATTETQNPPENAAERDALREALEKQLADAKQQLDQKLKDPKGDKPIFAIIPYDGPNGTHRRPIYLECNEQGVVVQPEGVVLAPTDLRPPYGPGNPLDAVLRTIRAEFPSQTGSLTSNPYPLLVVRPSGIKNYMLARAAMSGWDDQFGYELVSEELELAFPPSTPNLDKKIASAIELARQRQAALVMSMPQHYDQSQLEFYGDLGGSSGSGGDWQGESSSGSGSGSAPANGISSRNAGGRGGFSMTGAGQPGQTGLRESSGATGGGLLSGGGANTDNSWTMAQSAASNVDASTGETLPNSSQASGTSGSMSFFGSGGAGDGLWGSANGSGSDTSRTASNGSMAAGSTANDGGTPTGFGTTNGLAENTSTSGASASGSGSTSQSTSSNSLTNSGGPAGSSGTGGSASSASSSGGSMGIHSGGAQAGGSAASGSAALSSSAAGSAPGSSSTDPAQAGGTPSLNLSYGQNSGDSAQPIARSKGPDWAWRDGNRSDTAVVRAIRLQCYADRWVLLPDRSSPAARATVISLNSPPVQRAEQLAQAVLQRVDSWGVALAGGHWAPVLQVEVATNADVQFVQLQRMMEGSGVDVVRKSTISANQNLLQR